MKMTKKEKLNFSLRISVVDKCNFACLYCPRLTSMENFCPPKKKQDILNTKDFVKLIDLLLKKYTFSKVVVTGGEPLLATDLIDILTVIKKNNQFLELDTNGSLFNEKIWKSIKNLVDAVKMSFDSINEKEFKDITNCKSKFAFTNAKKLINACVRDNFPLTLNIVATKRNIEHINEIINFAKENAINTSILDLYYSKEKQDFWLNNYVHLENWVKKNKHQFERIEQTDDFGCAFLRLYYNKGKNFLRVKLSEAKTMRDDYCEKCSEFCQEGIFALRLSRQGWITSCQINEGIGLHYTELDKIGTIISRIKKAHPSTTSFEKLIAFYNLKIPHENCN